MLTARNLEHRYGGRVVLALDEFTVPRGEITALVGPNGSGKSALLRVLAFLEAPKGGTLSLGSRPVRTRAERLAARRHVTLVEQHPLLFDGTVVANLRYALGLHGVRGAPADERATAALTRLGIAHLAQRTARELSGGEGQRAAVARAVALQPDVLLLDEPFSAADRAAAGDLSAVLDALCRDGVAICFTSHQLEQAYRLAGRVIALTDGRLCAVTPENLFRTTIPPGDGPRVVRVGPLELLVVTDQTGPAAVAIPADDIVVSTAPLHSSARNQFTGRIVRISDDGRGGVSLGVDVGTELVAHITHEALADLGLSIGSSVVLSIKAMAVRVF